MSMNNYLMRDCPCKDCIPPKRHPGCHGDCPEKREWNEKKKAAMDAIQAEKDRHAQATGFLVDSQRKVAKAIGKNKWR